MTLAPVILQSKPVQSAPNVYVTVQPAPPAPVQSQSPYQDFGFWVNVALSGATLAVAVGALAIGLVAFLGYRGIKDIASRESTKHAQNAVDKYLKSDVFKSLIKQASEEAVQEQIKNKTIGTSPQDVVTPPDKPGKIELN